MKKILIIGLSLIAFNIFAAKIGYVNLEKIISTSQSLQDKQDKIVNSFKTKDEDLKKQADKLQKLVKEFESEKDDLTKEEKQQKFNFINKQQQQLQQLAKKTQEQFNLAMQEELSIFEDRVNQALKQFARSNKFDLIVYKDIAYASDNIDITDKIIKLLVK